MGRMGCLGIMGSMRIMGSMGIEERGDIYLDGMPWLGLD